MTIETLNCLIPGEGAAHRIVVSGITGHVGSKLTRQLIEVGSEVHGLTRRELPSCSDWPREVTLHHVDSSTEALVRLFEEIRPDTVIHLAALARRNHLISDVDSFVRANILYGTQLLEAMRLSGCKRFVTAESILQFSDAGEHRALNLYAATKQAFANLLVYYVDAFDLSAIALVLPTVYSEYETIPKLMTDIASALQNSTVLTLQSEDVFIDLVHVEDVANAFLKASSLLAGEAVRKRGCLNRYCVSSGIDVSPAELLARFERIGEKKLIVRREPSKGTSRRAKPWRGPVLPGWAPQIDIETGIKRMLSKRR